MGSNSKTIKSTNLLAILLALLHNEPISRVGLAQLTGLSTTTITNLVTELLNEGIVAEGADDVQERLGVGRPRTSLRLVAEARYAVGVHIGVGSIRVAVTNLRAQILTSLNLDHPMDLPAAEVLQRTVHLINKAIQHLDIDPATLIGVGVGASGLVNPKTGVNLIAPNLGWRDVEIKEILASELTLPICVDNNVRAMALGESLFGSAIGSGMLAFVYARIGVGAGFVIDGQLYRGSGAGAGEIGHTIVIPHDGPQCRCGRNGCLETLISEPAIMEAAFRLAKQEPSGLLAAQLQGQNEPTVDDVFSAARAGDQATRTMLDGKAEYMGLGACELDQRPQS